jgi:hypothetical protein
MNKFIPNNFNIPKVIETQDFKARMLSVNDLIKDYDAVMSSVGHLKGVFGPDESWPEGLTLEEDLIDLGWHQKEFQLRNSFAYTVMTPDESKCLGCFYIDPSEKEGYDASVILWVRNSELETGLDQKLFTTIKNWIDECWDFKSVAFPGRVLNWDHWNSLPDK